MKDLTKPCIAQTIGAVDAMFENATKITDKVFAKAQKLAIKDSKKTGYEPVLGRNHIEKALK